MTNQSLRRFAQPANSERKSVATNSARELPSGRTTSSGDTIPKALGKLSQRQIFLRNQTDIQNIPAKRCRSHDDNEGNIHRFRHPTDGSDVLRNAEHDEGTNCTPHAQQEQLPSDVRTFVLLFGVSKLTVSLSVQHLRPGECASLT